jgi:hypothetical protein
VAYPNKNASALNKKTSAPNNKTSALEMNASAPNKKTSALNNQENRHENEGVPSLRYRELKDFCKIIGIEMLELAKPLGYTPESFNVIRNQKKENADSFME